MCCFLSASPYPRQYTLMEQGWDNHDEYPIRNDKSGDTVQTLVWNNFGIPFRQVF